jgi:hypothetical protein
VSFWAVRRRLSGRNIAKMLKKIRPNEYLSEILEICEFSNFFGLIRNRVVFRMFPRVFGRPRRHPSGVGMQVAFS